MCASVHVCMLSETFFFFFFSLFATVGVCVDAVAWPEGTHCNGHPTGRKKENDETVGREAG